MKNIILILIFSLFITSCSVFKDTEECYDLVKQMTERVITEEGDTIYIKKLYYVKKNCGEVKRPLNNDWILIQ